MGRVVVIGDVGGHPDQLRWALSLVGARGAWPVLPPDVTVIQVGDLVDRGPDSVPVLALVDHVLRTQPGQWVQLVGNHEWQYLPEGERFWSEPLPAEGVRTLVDWWDRGLMSVAAAVATADGQEWLLTHAGLTVDAWKILDSPMTATTAAWLLNDRPEVMRWGWDPASERVAGPLWAGAGRELYEPWLAYYAGGASCRSDRFTDIRRLFSTLTGPGAPPGGFGSGRPWTGPRDRSGSASADGLYRDRS